MSMSWKIFNAFGIPVRLHISMLIIPLLAFSWAGDTGPFGLLMALVVAVLLFGSILLHELGHALTGRRFGVFTEDIVMTPIGGMARMRNIPQKPKAEIVIAVAGPLVSFALAAIFYAGTMATQIFPGHYGILPMILSFTSTMNLMLGLFNLIPALPMDGGRVFRGLLALKFSHLKATRIAASVGKYLAIAGIAWGIFRGPWTLVAIGIFVFFSASMEERFAVMQDAVRRAQEEGGAYSGGIPFGGGFPFGSRARTGNPQGYYVYQETRRPSTHRTSEDDWKDGASSGNAKTVDGVKVEIISRKDPE